jgi:hypothetical protein
MNNRIVALVACAAWLSGCARNPIAPGCERRTGTVLNAPDQAIARDESALFEVTSPENSNLNISVTWAARDADVKLEATIIDCGIHVGCQTGQPIVALTSQAAFRELRVDGSRGKRYRIRVSSDREVVVSLRVVYDTGTCT